MSYRCSVTIDDPRIPGTNSDFFYDRDQLGNITVVVYGKSLSVCSCTFMQIIHGIYRIARNFQGLKVSWIALQQTFRNLILEDGVVRMVFPVHFKLI